MYYIMCTFYNIVDIIHSTNILTTQLSLNIVTANQNSLTGTLSEIFPIGI